MTGHRFKLGKLVVLSFITWVAYAGGASAAGLLIPTGQNQSLALENQRVEVQINNGIAVTHVTQEFRNDSPQQLEALYVFPVPREASVSNFSMWINGKEVIGEVLERQRARDVYQQVTRVEKKDPGLLELVGHKKFEMRVFPVPAKGTQKIQITYYQTVDYDGGFGTYVYPLEMKEAGSDLLKEFSVLVDIKSDIPIKRIYSPSHKDAVVTAQRKNHSYRASLEEPKGNLKSDFVLVYELERERIGLNLLTSRDKLDDGYFMFQLTPGPVFDETKKQVNVTFVLDISGSMKIGDRLSVGKEAVGEALKQLREGDSFNIVAFNIAAKSLAEQPLPATPENIQKAVAFLNQQRAGGGTDLVPALDRAFELQVPDARNVILVLSDGDATEAAKHADYLASLKRRNTGARIFSFGIGNEVNRPLLDRLAEETGGYADYLSNQDEVERKIRLMQMKIASPAIEKLTIRFEGVATYDTYPQKVTTLYRGQQLVLFGRYKEGGQAKLHVTGEIQGRPESMTATLDFPAADNTNPQIQRMWAWRKAEGLMNQVRETGESESLRKEIVEVGTKYSIVTAYTSFLVLENEAEYQRFNIQRLNPTRIANERTALQQQWQAPQADNRVARDVQFTPPAGNEGGGRSRIGGGGGSVEWVFLAGVALLAAGGRMRKRE